MAALDFPASPTDGQTFSAPNGVVYVWSTAKGLWLTQGPSVTGAVGDFTAWHTGFGLLTAGAVIVFPTIMQGNQGGYYNVSNGRWTPPAGRYFVFATLSALQSASATVNSITLRKNGVGITVSGMNETTSGANAWGNATIALTVDANGTDFYEVFATSSSNSTSTNAIFSAFPLNGMAGPMGPAGPDSRLLQTVSFQTGAVATGTTQMTSGDNIPTITQGDQYMTLAITPKSATSKLMIDVVWNGSNGGGSGQMLVALFQDSTTNALAAVSAHQTVANQNLNLKFTHIMTSGTTSATTFRVRAGANVAGTTTFNGNSGTRNWGGVMASSIVIHEEVA